MVNSNVNVFSSYDITLLQYIRFQYRVNSWFSSISYIPHLYFQVSNESTPEGRKLLLRVNYDNIDYA